jgi:glucose dehydrogenase
MICAECVRLIAELQRTEIIYAEKLRIFREKNAQGVDYPELTEFAIAKRSTKFDQLICRLQLKRHQYHHPAAPPRREPSQAFSSFKRFAA